jgi:hypothetical protein
MHEYTLPVTGLAHKHLLAKAVIDIDNIQHLMPDDSAQQHLRFRHLVMSSGCHVTPHVVHPGHSVSELVLPTYCQSGLLVCNVGTSQTVALMWVHTMPHKTLKRPSESSSQGHSHAAIASVSFPVPGSQRVA